MNVPPSDHVVWKIIMLFGIPVMYIVGACVFHRNGWGYGDYKGVVAQFVAVALGLFGPGWMQRAFGGTDDDSQDIGPQD